MNEDRIKGNWKQFTGKLQERHGLAREAAEKQFKEWQERHPGFYFPSEG